MFYIKQNNKLRDRNKYRGQTPGGDASVTPTMKPLTTDQVVQKSPKKSKKIQKTNKNKRKYQCNFPI